MKKSIISLLGGSVLAQLITLISMPIFTRIYSTEEIGIYSLILVNVSMFGAIMCAKYDIVIVSEKDQENVYALIKLSFLITLTLSLIIIFFNLLRGTSFYISVIISIILFLTGIKNILTAYNNRKKEYKIISQTMVQRVLIKEIIINLLGTIKNTYNSIIIGLIIGEIVGLKKQFRSLAKDFKKVISANIMKTRVFTNNINQLYFSTPSVFLNAATYSSIALIIEFKYGLIALAMYFMTYKILNMPLTVISANVSKVFFKEFSDSYNKGENYIKVFNKFLITLILISIVLFTFIYFSIPYIFDIVLGNDWDVASTLAQLLIPLFVTRFITSSLSTVLVTLRKQNIDFYLSLLFIIALLFAYLFQNKGSLEEFISTIALSYSFVYIIILIVYIFFLKRSVKV